MRTKNPARTRKNVKIYPAEWEVLKNERRSGETFADVFKRLLGRAEK